MKPKLDWNLPLGLLASLAFYALPALAAAETESNLEKTFPSKPDGQLVVEADRGSISITTGDRADVSILVKRSLSRTSEETAAEVFAAHEVSFAQEGDRVIVRGKLKNNLTRTLNRAAQNLNVRYEIAVPRQFNLDLRTAAGSISSSDIQGRVKARTSGGSLKFAAIRGPFDGETAAGSIRLGSASGAVLAKTSGGSIDMGTLDSETTAETSAGSISVDLAKAKLVAKTSGGSVRVGQVDAPAELRTSAGSITVKSARGPLVARTAGGSITIDDAQATVLAETSAGSVSAAFSAQPDGDCKLTTSGGSITVRLDPELGFELDARTSGGRVSTDIPVTATVSGEVKTDGLKGKLNGGGGALVLRTSAGNISIKKR